MGTAEAFLSARPECLVSFHLWEFGTAHPGDQRAQHGVPATDIRLRRRGVHMEPASRSKAKRTSKAAGKHVVSLDQELNKLAEFDPRQARIVELRFFGGLTENEVAEVMAISIATVQREWRTARAELHRRLVASAPRTSQAGGGPA
jgi:predicted DNA-binding protein (UPF0251 family)